MSAALDECVLCNEFPRNVKATSW